MWLTRAVIGVMAIGVVARGGVADRHVSSGPLGIGDVAAGRGGRAVRLCCGAVVTDMTELARCLNHIALLGQRIRLCLGEDRFGSGVAANYVGQVGSLLLAGLVRLVMSICSSSLFLHGCERKKTNSIPVKRMQRTWDRAVLPSLLVAFVRARRVRFLQCDEMLSHSTLKCQTASL